MNKFLAFLLSLTLTLLSVACKKDTEVVAPGDSKPDSQSDSPSQSAAITPVGTPVGAAITAIIGPAGGTIESADKQIQISIPAGALRTNQTISVQPITNECPSGTGQAYRLTPHGLTFAKPATITFHYTDETVANSAPEMLRVAYQSDKGHWLSPRRYALDTASHHFSVQTTHFSDWTGFKNVFIYAEDKVVVPGGNMSLKVLQHIDESAPPADKDTDLIMPTVPSLLSAKYVGKWVVSAGSVAPDQNTATFYAPSTPPVQNPVAVTVSLNKTITVKGEVFHDIRLVLHILVAAEGISVQIDGGAWKTYPGGINVTPSVSVAATREGSETCSFAFPGNKPGTYRWSLDTRVPFLLNKGHILYQH
ncbi:MAG TPA: hypothetical protein VGA96_11990, partial [Fibrella sp.]